MKSVTIILLFLISHLANHAQRVYPVEIQVQLPNTIPSVWNLWWESNAGFQLSILLKDIHEPSLEVFPEIELNGANLSMNSTAEAITTIRPMEAKWLTGAFFETYWHLKALNCAGSQAARLRQSGVLEDGYYTFSIVIKERYSKQAVSARYQQSVWIKSLDPPRISFPQCQSKLPAAMIPNIPFQWQQPNGSRPGDIQYEFVLSDFVTEDVQIDEAWASSLPLFKTTIMQANLLYGAAMPTLSTGKKYLWKVRAISSSGLFIKNDGWSVTCSFIYGDPCHPPKDLKLVGLNGTDIMLNWRIDGLNQDGYEIRIRPQKDSNQVYTYESKSESITLSQLNPQEEYWAEVCQYCPSEKSSYTARISIGGMEEIRTRERCTPDTTITKATTQPLAILFKGDVIQVDGFQLRILEANGGQGIFSGKAIGYMPYLGRTLRFHFQGIEISDAYEVVNGRVFADSEMKPINAMPSKVQPLANFCNPSMSQDPRGIDQSMAQTATTNTKPLETVSINNEYPIPIGDTIILNGKQVVMSESLELKVGDTMVWNGQTIMIEQIGPGDLAQQYFAEAHQDIWEEAIKELKQETKDSIQYVSLNSAAYADSIRTTLPDAPLIPFIIIGEKEEYLQPGMSQTFIPLYPEEFNEVEDPQIRKIFRCHYLLFLEDKKWRNLKRREAQLEGLRNKVALDALMKEWNKHLQKLSTQEVAAISQNNSTHKAAIKSFLRR